MSVQTTHYTNLACSKSDSAAISEVVCEKQSSVFALEVVFAVENPLTVHIQK